MEFYETLTLRMPDVTPRIEEFAESAFSENHSLVIEVAAIHEGTTANFNHYSAEELEKSLESWTTPYPKPIILHHDPMTEPMGRVIGARMDQEADGTPFVRLQVAITDPAAIQKVKDKRYLTGSVGGKAGEARCSVCDTNWAEAAGAGLPCRHGRGKSYNGKLATLEMRNLTFKEYSFVNVPADSHSTIRSVTAAAESEVEESDASPVHFYSLDMQKESIVEIMESAEDRDVLAGRKKKEATPLYLGLKGAFLTALAFSEAEDTHKENSMADDQIVEEEDILAVTTELSADLAKQPEEAATEEAPAEEETAEETTTSEEKTEEEAPAEETETEAKTEEATDEAAAEEAPEEGERPAGQEKAHAKDVDPEDSKGADKSRESEEETETVAEGTDADGELNEQVTALESRLAEAEESITALRDENAKLKAALKRQLAERVVDTKIAVGLAEFENRESLLEQHVSRTASSLKDALIDLAAMPKSRPDYSGAPQVTEESLAVTDKDEKATLVELVETDTTPKALDPEEVFLDVFMGRKAL